MANKHDPDGAILSAELASAYSRESGATLESFTALRDTVCQYVEAMREGGMSLEEIVARVSAILERARVAFHAGKEATPPPSESDKAMAKQIVDWCTEFFHVRSRKRG